MPEGPRNGFHGTAGVTSINCDVTRLGHAAHVRVTLTADYTIVCPPGAPCRLEFTGSATPEYPKTIPSRTVLLLHKYEADALKAAGAAV